MVVNYTLLVADSLTRNTNFARHLRYREVGMEKRQGVDTCRSLPFMSLGFPFRCSIGHCCVCDAPKCSVLSTASNIPHAARADQHLG
jgi:hypothetical protein